MQNACHKIIFSYDHITSGFQCPSVYRQTTDCTEGGGLTREHWTHKEHFFKLHSVSFIYRFDCVFNCTSKKLITKQTSKGQGLSWPWTNGSWIYNYLCNQCQSPLTLSVRISIRARCTTLCDKICQWLATGFLRVLRFPPPKKLTATIYLKYCWKWH